MRSSAYYGHAGGLYHDETESTSPVGPLTIWITIGICILGYYLWRKRQLDALDAAEGEASIPRAPMTESEIEAFERNEARRKEQVEKLQENYTKISERSRSTQLNRLDRKILVMKAQERIYGLGRINELDVWD